MKRSIFRLLLSGAILLFLSTSQIFAQTVTLGDVSESLEEYEDTDYDFIGEEITYKEIDEDKYDSIFKESAIIYGTVEQVSQTLDAINEGTLSADIGYTMDLITFATSDLPDMQDRAEELLDKAKSLKPEDDFSGFGGAAKVPKATSGIKTATDQLNKSIERLPAIIENVNELAKNMDL